MKRRARRRRQVHLVHRGRMNRAGRKSSRAGARAYRRLFCRMLAAMHPLAPAVVRRAFPMPKSYALHYNPEDVWTDEGLAAAEREGVEQLALKGVLVALHVPRWPTTLIARGTVALVARPDPNDVIPWTVTPPQLVALADAIERRLRAPVGSWLFDSSYGVPVASLLMDIP